MDETIRSVIRTRITRMKIGNFGDHKLLKGTEGVWELRVDYGSGYRIYFGISDKTIVLLLLGGDKKSQKRDIEKSKQYWLNSREQI